MRLSYTEYDRADFSELKDKTLASVVVSKDGDELLFTTVDGVEYLMHHEQDCCEHVRLEETIGDLKDLISSPILKAEERSDGKQDVEYGDSSTWTFYEIATIKGSVTLRWLGESNGYYSESVDFVRLKK